MKQKFLGWAAVAIMATPLWAADTFKLPADLDKLADRATESVDVTLDESMLSLAGGFLSKDDPDEAQVKKMIGKLRGIYVRSFEFDKEGQYSMSDVDALRTQLKGPNWSRIAGIKSIKGERAEVYVLKNGNQIGGMVVLDAEPKELTIVHIDGDINPEDLGRLSGHLGIPDFEKDRKKDKGDGKSHDKKDKDDDEQEN